MLPTNILSKDTLRDATPLTVVDKNDLSLAKTEEIMYNSTSGMLEYIIISITGRKNRRKFFAIPACQKFVREINDNKVVLNLYFENLKNAKGIQSNLCPAPELMDIDKLPIFELFNYVSPTA